MEIKPAGRCARQAFDVYEPVCRAKLSVTAEAEGQLHVLSVPSLDRFHETGGLRRGDVDALAVEYRTRPSVWATYHDNRNARSIEAGEVRNPGDAECAQQRPDAIDRVVRRRRAMGAEAVGLGGSAVTTESQHGIPRSEGSPNARYYRGLRRGTGESQPRGVVGALAPTGAAERCMLTRRRLITAARPSSNTR